MRLTMLAAGIVLSMCCQAGAGTSGDQTGGHTTIVRNANGETVITQSGDPANSEVRIESAPGRTTVYRHSGGNTAIVTQSSGGAAAQDLPEWMRKLLGR